MSVSDDPRLDQVIATLRERVDAAGQPQHKHNEIGQFIELLELAAAAALGKKRKLRVSQWHVHLKGINPGIFKQLEAAYGLRNVGTHLNPEQAYLDDGTVTDDLRRVERALPWVVQAFRQAGDVDFIHYVLDVADQTGWARAADSAPGGSRIGWLPKLAFVAAVAVGLVVAMQPGSPPIAEIASRAQQIEVGAAADRGAGTTEVGVVPAGATDEGTTIRPETEHEATGTIAVQQPDVVAAESEAPVAPLTDTDSNVVDSPDADVAAETTDDAAGASAAILFDELASFASAAPSAKPSDPPRTHRWAEQRMREAEGILAERTAPQRKERRILARARLAVLERCCSTAPKRDCLQSPLKLCLELAIVAAKAVGHTELQDGSAKQARLALRLAEELERPVRVAASRGPVGVSQPVGPRVMPRAWAPAAAGRQVLQWAQTRKKGVRWGTAHWFLRMPAPLVLWRRAVDSALKLAAPHGAIRGPAADMAWRAMSTWVVARYVLRSNTEHYLAARGRTEETRLTPDPDDDLAVFRVLERYAQKQSSAKAASAMVAGLDCVLNGRNCSN